jgi:ankyrin repeat protein
MILLHLPHLPSELLLQLATSLETERDINSLSQTNRRLHALLNPYLYRLNSRGSNHALLWAAQHDNVATARLCVQEGANVRVTDSKGRTPLSWAAQHRHEAMVKLLLGTGQAILNSKNCEGKTARQRLLS